MGTLAVGTAMGNLLSEGVKKLFAPAPRAATSLGAPFPTWPPAELLAAAQPAQWLADAAWPGELWLTLTTYHGHALYLYAEAGLPYVLWQAPRGDWRLLTTPAELAQLARYRPVKPALLAIQRQCGIPLEDIALGTPLQWTLPAPPLLGL